MSFCRELSFVLSEEPKRIDSEGLAGSQDGAQGGPFATFACARTDRGAVACFVAGADCGFENGHAGAPGCFDCWLRMVWGCEAAQPRVRDYLRRVYTRLE